MHRGLLLVGNLDTHSRLTGNGRFDPHTRGGKVEGDIIHEDTDRTMNVTIQNATLKGVIADAYISLEGSKWYATGDSSVCLIGNVEAAQIDAPAGVTVAAMAGEGCALSGEYVLSSGGKLTVK